MHNNRQLVESDKGYTTMDEKENEATAAYNVKIRARMHFIPIVMSNLACSITMQKTDHAETLCKEKASGIRKDADPVSGSTSFGGEGHKFDTKCTR